MFVLVLCRTDLSLCPHLAVQELEALWRALRDALAVDLVAARLAAFNEAASAEEAGAVHAALAFFQNLTEVAPGEAPAALAAQPDLLRWLLRRLHPREFKEFDANKAAAAELLAVLAQARAPPALMPPACNFSRL